MYPSKNDGACTSRWSGRWSRALVALLVCGVAASCASSDDDPSQDEPEEPELGVLEQALYDSNDIVTTAGAAMVDAYFATIDAGDFFEYCGLVVQKRDGTFRASPPVTSRAPRVCRLTISRNPGDKIVGYYHTHTSASIPGISPDDLAEAHLTGREYFVLSTVTGCGQRYSPKTLQFTNLGCPFASF
jgi:hypothetical protein